MICKNNNGQSILLFRLPIHFSEDECPNQYEIAAKVIFNSRYDHFDTSQYQV